MMVARGKSLHEHGQHALRLPGVSLALWLRGQIGEQEIQPR